MGCKIYCLVHDWKCSKYLNIVIHYYIHSCLSKIREGKRKLGHLEDHPSLSRWVTSTYSSLSSGTCPQLVRSGSILSPPLRSQEKLLGISNAPHDHTTVGWIGQLPLHFPRLFETCMIFFRGQLNLLHKSVNPLCFCIIFMPGSEDSRYCVLRFFFLSKDITVHLEK